MRAELRVELRSATGETIEVRHAHNAVMRSGATLIASLFTGQGAPITHMGVGTSASPETDTFSTEQLTNDASDGGTPLDGDTEAPLPIESFQPPEIDETRRVVRVRLRGTLPPNAAVGVVREAGLISRTDAGAVLYNRVTFAPITKGDDHELTLFWEVTFPYGDLQWVM